MTDLIQELEQAQEGSRELSDKVLLAIGWRRMGEYVLADGEPYVGWQAPGADGEKFFNHAHSNSGREAPSPTEDLQDALGLVLEGCLKPTISGGPKGWWAQIDDGEEVHEADATNPALALTIAAIKARQKE